MTFTLIIPTFRRPDALRETLAAVGRIDFPADRWEVIVIDDGSGDETSSVVARGMPAARYVAQQNRGAAAARNRGAQDARFETLVFLDDDMIVRSDHLLRHQEAHGRFGECIVNGHWEFSEAMKKELESTPFGRFRLEVETWVKEGISRQDLGDGYSAPSSLTACNLSISRRAFLDLGGFDESFPAAGAEDQELAVRARLAGLRFVDSRSILLEHNDGGVTFRQFCRRQRQGSRSAAVLASKHPDTFGAKPLIAENGRVRRQDPVGIKLKKALKRVLSTSTGLALVHSVIGAAERLRPDSPTLRRSYWVVSGLYIYRGVLDEQ